MKLFQVDDGDYSDYHVCGIFSTREKAEHAKKFYQADRDISEIEVDALPPHPKGMFWHSVQMNREGNTFAVKIENGKYSHDREWAPYGDDETVIFDMWARDEKHAVKIANERRVRLIADNEWTSNWEEWVAKSTAQPRKEGEG